MGEVHAGDIVVFLGNHGAVVCGERMAHAYDDLYYLERTCMAQVMAQLTGRPFVPVDASIAERERDQTLGERLQSELFFEALRRTCRRRDRARFRRRIALRSFPMPGGKGSLYFPS